MPNARASATPFIGCQNGNLKCQLDHDARRGQRLPFDLTIKDTFLTRVPRPGGWPCGPSTPARGSLPFPVGACILILLDLYGSTSVFHLFPPGHAL